MSFPATQDVFSREANEVAGVGGTFTDANKQNAVYALLEQMQLTYGLSGDVASSLGSHTAQIKYLLAGGAGGIVQAPAAPGAPTDGMLWIDNDQTPPGLYRWKSADSLWHLVGADAIWIGGRALDPADVPADGDAITWDVVGNRWHYAPPVGFTDPMTTVGDLLYRNTSNLTARLPLATAEGMMLARAGGVPAWVTPAYIPSPGTPQQGDTLYYDGTTWTRLGPGTSGQFLKTQGGSANPVWSALPAAGGAITSPAGSVQGDVLYYSGTDWVRLGAGTSGQFLRTAGAAANPTWATPASGMTNPMTSQGDVIYGDIGGGPLRLPRGSNGQVLTLVAGLPGWAASASGGHAIQDEGTPLTQRAALNFIGSSVTLTDDAANNRTNVTITAGAGTGGHTIQDEGSPLTARTGLNFIGLAVAAADDSANDRTNITVLAYNQVKDAAGTALTARTTLKFAGTGVVVADTAGETVATIAAGFADPLTTIGDLIFRNSSNVTARLGIGSSNQVLTVSGGVPVWATPGAASGWALGGNNVGSEQALGTLDGFALPIRTNNTERLRIYNAFPTTVVKTALGVDDRAYLSASIDGTMTCSRTLTTVTQTAGTPFAPQHVGRLLVWNDGNIGTITAYTSTTVVTTAESGTVASQVATLKSPGFAVSATGDAILGGANPQSLGASTPTLELRGGQPDLNKSGGLYWRNWDGTRLAVGHYTSTGLFKLGTTSAHDAQLVANDVQKLRLMSGGNVRVHPTSANDNGFAYNTSSLLVTQQTPTATATLNDPQSVLYLVRDGTAAQCFGAGAALRLSRWENNGTNSRSRLDLSLAHGAFDVQSVTPMVWLSNGNVGVNTPTEFGGGAGVVGLLNRTTAPTTNPTGALVLYSESGVLKYRTTDGSVARLPTPTTVSSAMMYCGSNQTSTGAGLYQRALLNTVSWDNRSELDTTSSGAHPNAFVAIDAGHYLANAQVYWTSPPAGRIITVIYINGAFFGYVASIVADGVNNQTSTGALLLNLNAGDYVQVYFWHSGTGTPTINGGFAGGTYMIVERLD